MIKSKIKKRRLKVFPFSRLFPNLVTLGGLCCGLSAMRFAIDSRFEIAVALLVAAAIIDGMDGRIARLLNSTSVFGAHLDSLSDFLCFGISPAFVLYMWKMHEIKGIGWAAVLFFAICCALRLARFNTNLDDDNILPWQKKFFTGIPSPAGGMLSLMPLVSSFYMEPGIFGAPIFCILWMALIAVLMASRIPTFAAKRLAIHHEWVLPIMLICGFGLVIVLIEPWIMFSILGLIYFATVPYSVIRYRKFAASHGAALTPDESSLSE